MTVALTNLIITDWFDEDKNHSCAQERKKKTYY